jgi:glycosyltransferase involved in cell wall biosynthesis
LGDQPWRYWKEALRVRILMLLAKRFPPDIRVENEAASLLQVGHDVHLLCRGDARDAIPVHESLGDLVVHTLTPPDERRGWTRYVPNVPLLWFSDAHWAREIRALWRSEGPFDVIHVHDLPLVKTALSVAKRTGADVVADLHENYPMALAFNTAGKSYSPLGRFLLDPQRWERYEATSVPDCSGIIAVNEEMRSRLDAAGISSDRITLVENFVESERFLGYAQDATIATSLKDRFVITYVGGFGVHRGLETALAAMPAVIRAVPQALLLLVGDGGNKSDLEMMSRELALQDHVRFEGWVDFAKVPSYMAASDVCIVPPISSVQTEASLPHKIFQYMLMDKPVVASACAGIARVIEDTRCGLLFPPGDSDALAAALIRLTDASLRARLGENGRRAVLDRYTWSHASARLIRLYEGLTLGRENTAMLSTT